MNIKIRKKLLLLLLTGTVLTTGCNRKVEGEIYADSSFKVTGEISEIDMLELTMFAYLNVPLEVLKNADVVKLQSYLFDNYNLVRNDGEKVIDIYNKTMNQLCGNIAANNNQLIVKLNSSDNNDYDNCYREYVFNYDEKDISSHVLTTYIFTEENGISSSYLYSVENKNMVSQAMIMSKDKSSHSVFVGDINGKKKLIVEHNGEISENLLSNSDYMKLSQNMHAAGVDNNMYSFISYLKQQEDIEFKEDVEEGIQRL